MIEKSGLLSYGKVHYFLKTVICAVHAYQHAKRV